MITNIQHIHWLTVKYAVSFCAFISGLYLTKKIRRWGAVCLSLRCVPRQREKEISMENLFGLVHYCNFLLPHWWNNTGLHSSAHKVAVMALENWFDDVCVVTGVVTSCFHSNKERSDVSETVNCVLKRSLNLYSMSGEKKRRKMRILAKVTEKCF